MDGSFDVTDKISGFTPILDSMVKRYGLIGANVYGVVLRHAKMRNGVCSASQERMAELLGINRMTVNKWIAKLCDDGYLEDTTPDAKNRTHVYRVTGKAGLQTTIEAFDLGDNQNSSDDLGDSLNSTGDNQNSTGASLNSSTASLNSSTANQDSTRILLRDKVVNKLRDKVVVDKPRAKEPEPEHKPTTTTPDNWTSLFIDDYLKAKGEEPNKELAEKAVTKTLEYINGKPNYAVKYNFTWIDERYSMLLKTTPPKRDYTLPEGYEVPSSEGMYEYDFRGNKVLVGEPTPDDDIQDDDIQEADYQVPKDVQHNFATVSATWPFAWRTGMQPIRASDESVVIGVEGHSLEVAQARYGRTLENTFMRTVEFEVIQ